MTLDQLIEDKEHAELAILEILVGFERRTGFYPRALEITFAPEITKERASVADVVMDVRL